MDMSTLFESIYDKLGNGEFDTKEILSEGFFDKLKANKSNSEIKKLYDNFVKWWDKPYTLVSWQDDYFVMARLLKISSMELAKKVLSTVEQEDLSTYYNYRGITQSQLKRFETQLKRFKTGKICPLLQNDEHIVAIDPSSKEIYDMTFGFDNIKITKFNYQSYKSHQFIDSDILNWMKENNITFKK